MLSANCSEWSIGKAYILCPTVTIVKWCHTVMQAVNQHQGGCLTDIKSIENWKINKDTYFDEPNYQIKSDKQK